MPKSPLSYLAHPPALSCSCVSLRSLYSPRLSSLPSEERKDRKREDRTPGKGRQGASFPYSSLLCAIVAYPILISACPSRATGAQEWTGQKQDMGGHRWTSNEGDSRKAPSPIAPCFPIPFHVRPDPPYQILPIPALSILTGEGRQVQDRPGKVGMQRKRRAHHFPNNLKFHIVPFPLLSFRPHILFFPPPSP